MILRSFLCCFLFTALAYGQNFTVSSGITSDEINTNSNDCGEPFFIPVINSSGTVEGISSVGTFSFTSNQANTDSFELERGVVLSTGNIDQFLQGNTRIEGTTAWGGSSLYESAVGAPAGSSVNATDVVLEFVALQDEITLNYVFGSNQYSSSNNCISEGAAILIKRQGEPDTAFINAAIINGGPVTTANINFDNAGACDDTNSALLSGAPSVETPSPAVARYTSTLTAVLSNLDIGQTYELRAIVADIDPLNDSVLFLEFPENTLSFNEAATTNAGQINQGNTVDEFNVGVCASEVAIGFDNPFLGGVSYSWIGPVGGIVGGGNTSRITVTASGVYTLTISPNNLASCSIVKIFNVDLENMTDVLGVSDLVECANTANVMYDLTQREPEIVQIANIGAISQVIYSDQSNVTIANPTSYIGTDGEVVSFEATFATGCVGTGSFRIRERALTTIVPDRDPNNPNERFQVCDEEEIVANVGQFDGDVLLTADDLTDYYFATLTSGTIEYFENAAGTLSIDFDTFIFRGDTQITARVTGDDGCVSDPVALSVEVLVPPSGVPSALAPIRACGIETQLGSGVYIANFDLTERIPTANEPISVTFHRDAQDAMREVVVGEITNPTSFQNDESLANTQEIFARIVRVDTPNCPLVRNFQLQPYFPITENEAFLGDLYLCEEQQNTSTSLPEADFLPLIKANIFDPITLIPQYDIRIFEDRNRTQEIIVPVAISTETFFASEETSVFIEISANQTLPPGDRLPDCTQVYELLLFVNNLGTINAPTTEVTVCGDSEGVFQGILTEFTDVVATEINTNPNIQLRYYESMADALALNNPIDDTTVTPANTSPITYFVQGLVTPPASANQRRIPGPACPTNIVEVVLNVQQGPELLPSPETSISICNTSSSELVDFRVSNNINTIVAPSSDIVVSYHAELADAENNVNPIIDQDYNESEFALIDSDNIFYVRIEDTSTSENCFLVVQQEVIFNTTPDTPDFIEDDNDFLLCVSSGDALERIFDLTSKDAELLQGVSGRTIRYYVTEPTAISGGSNGQLNPNGHPVANQEIIWYRIENNTNTDCFSVGQLRLRVEERTNIDLVVNVRDCASISPGFGLFNLGEIRTNLMATDVSSVEFYTNRGDAGFDEIAGQETPEPNRAEQIQLSIEGDYANVIPFEEEIFARVTTNEGCVSFQRILLIVEDNPDVVINDFNACVNDLSDPQDIRVALTQANFVNPRTNNVQLRNIDPIEYFTTPNRLVADQISNPNNFVVNNAFNTIYVRVYFASLGTNGESCFRDSQFNINLNIFPEVNSLTTFSRCENAPNSDDYTIDLNALSASEISQIYSGNDEDIEIRFYDTPSTSSPQITSFNRSTVQNEIYATAFIVQDGVDVCNANSFTTIRLDVIDNPSLHSPAELFLCDSDSDPLNGVTNSNLNLLKSQILNEPVADLNNFNIRFFEGTTELIGSNYPLVSGNSYRAEAYNVLDSNCSQELTFTLQLIPGPNIGDTSIPALRACDISSDDQEAFNLTLVENIAPFNNVSNYTFEYFSDAARLMNIPLVDLSSYVVNGVGRHEIFVRLSSTVDPSCQFDSSFQVEIQALPNLNIPANTVDYCTNETIGEIRTELQESVSIGLTPQERANFQFTLHLNPSGTDVPLLDTDIVSGSVIYVKAINPASSLNCESIQGINVQGTLPPPVEVNFNPQECDIDGADDGMITILLSEYNEMIFTGPNTELPNHTIEYFDTGSGAPLVGFVSVNSATSIVARVTSNTTPNCVSEVNFNINIQSGPEVFTPPSSLLTICNDSEVLDSTTLYGDVATLQAAILGSQDPVTHEVLFFESAVLAEDNVNAIDLNVVEVTTQSYVVKVRNINTECEALDTISITVSNLPEIGILTDNTYCENSTLGMNRERWDRQILANIPTSRQASFEVSYHTDNIPDDANMLSETDVLLTATGQITVRVTNPDGCFNVATVPITRVDLPVINSLSLVESRICDENDGVSDGIATFSFSSLNTAFLGNQVPSNDFRFTYHTSVDNAENDIEIISNENISSGEYVVKLENIVTGCSQIETFNFTVNTIPQIDPSEIAICQGESSRIINKRTSNTNDDIYLWEFSDEEGNQTRANVSSFEIDITSEDVGDIVTLTVTNSNTGCSNQMSFPIIEYITPTVEVIVNNDFGNGTATVQVQEGGENFMYELQGPVNVAPQESNEFTNLLPGTYTVVITDPNSCGPIETTFTYVDYLPYFSPNDDGVADEWRVSDLQQEFPGAVVYIHDRYGKLITTLVGDASWDGTYGGTPMPTDDYWILIEFTDRPSINDHITLKR